MAKIGVIHYNFPGFTFDQFLKFCKDTGYQYTELSIDDAWNEKDPGGQPEKKAEAIRKQMTAFGLKVSAVSARNNFLVAGKDAMAAQVTRLERVGRIAKILGTDILRCDGGWPSEAVAESQWVPLIVEGFKRSAEFAPKVGVRFALDNHGIVTNDGEREVAIFEAVNSDRVGANIDTMNYRWAGHDLDTIRHYYDIVAPYALHTHMKDGTGSMQDYKGAALGDGEIDLKHAVEVIKKAGYKGAWVAEYEGPEAEGGVGYAKCYQWLKEHV